jgi:hypothetical protein
MLTTTKNNVQHLYIHPFIMANNGSYNQNQHELLQHIAAIHEQKSSHRRDLSIEAMTEDLDHILSSSDQSASGGEPNIDAGAHISKASFAANTHQDRVPRGDAAVTSSTVAGVTGSQQDC